MARPKGIPKTGGRKPGSRNKTPNDLKLLCQQHTEMCLSGLVEMASNPKHLQQLGAIKELLDRGWGKSATVMTGEGGSGPVQIAFVTGFADAAD